MPTNTKHASFMRPSYQHSRRDRERSVALQTHKSLIILDMKVVSRFAQQAETILAAAESAGSCSPMTILLGPAGIRMIADSDWPLDSLLWHHGASTAYRISESKDSIRVEARQGMRRCLVESKVPADLARAILNRS